MNWNNAKGMHCLLPACFLAFAVSGDIAAAGSEFAPDRPSEVIEIALALDTSGSMGPLVDSARLGFWDIVLDLSRVEPEPTLRFALLTFGTCHSDWKSGWVSTELDFTQDLDAFSEKLFAPTCDGGGEYVGRVLQTAISDLSWSSSNDAMKLIFVIGNESADQDPKLNLMEVSDIAIEEGVVVHALFCGAPHHEYAKSWQSLADLSGTPFLTMDHKAGTAVRSTPYDAELNHLASELHATFLPLGEGGARRQAELAARDAKARSMNASAAAARAQVQGTSLFLADWELIDAVDSGQVDLLALDKTDLPARLKGLSLEERVNFVNQTRKQREAIKQEIAELGAQRRAYIVEQLHANGYNSTRTFSWVMRQAIRQSFEEHVFWLMGAGTGDSD